MDESDLIRWASSWWADWLVRCWCVIMSGLDHDKFDVETLWHYASICGTTM